LEDGLRTWRGQGDEKAEGIGGATPAAEVLGEEVLDGHGVAEKIGEGLRLCGTGLNAVGTESESVLPALGSEGVLEAEKEHVGLAVAWRVWWRRPDGMAGV